MSISLKTIATAFSTAAFLTFPGYVQAYAYDFEELSMHITDRTPLSLKRKLMISDGNRTYDLCDHPEQMDKIFQAVMEEKHAFYFKPNLMFGLDFYIEQLQPAEDAGILRAYTEKPINDMTPYELTFSYAIIQARQDIIAQITPQIRAQNGSSLDSFCTETPQRTFN